MATNPFPPQAYTRETMIKAFEWLQTQSPQVRELASTTDLLMSLYSKAMIQGKDALERPQLANFKNELRHLAGQLGEFDTTAQEAAFHAHQMPPAQASLPPPNASASAHVGPGQAPTPASFHGVQNQQPAHASASGAYLGAAIPSSPGSVRAAHGSNVKTSAPAPTHGFLLDSKSNEWLDEIQRELNLESPTEALRLAISVGYSRLSELFPKRR